MSQKLCERCHINPATVVIRAIAPDGTARSHHLCQGCASKMFPAINNFPEQENNSELRNVMQPPAPSTQEMSALASQIMDLFSTSGSENGDNAHMKQVRMDLEKMFDELNSNSCPKCGTLSTASLRNMQLGCRECLNAFREEYRKLLSKQTQELAKHRQESTLTPLKSAAQEYLTAQIELLEDKLKSAVQAEEYEQAGELKAKIESLYGLMTATEGKGRGAAAAAAVPENVHLVPAVSALPLWLPEEPESCRQQIRLSSFVRYERNLAAVHTLPPYTEAGHVTDAAKAMELLLPVLRNDPLFSDARELDPRNIPLSERRSLYLNGIAPWDFLNPPVPMPSRIFITPDRRVVALLNSRAHLSVTFWNLPDLKSGSAREVQLLDKRLSSRLAFAADAEFGAVTRDLTALGSGVTIGEVLHLPLLTMESGVQRIANACKQLGFRIRVSFPGDTVTAEPYIGAGERAMSFAAGGLVTIVDAFAMGDTLNERCRSIQRQAVRLANHELELRRNLGGMKELLLKVRDIVGRSASMISGAAVCNPVEYRHILSALWLGMELGMLTSVDHLRLFKAYAHGDSCNPAGGEGNAAYLKQAFLIQRGDQEP
ncbi:MAG: UvrB/UvrC motif-containing protein [Victivallales bacterium]|nr:UvrB/UvrC motif-containing protein [Victivallales bacterium]